MYLSTYLERGGGANGLLCSVGALYWFGREETFCFCMDACMRGDAVSTPHVCLYDREEICLCMEDTPVCPGGRIFFPFFVPCGQ